MVAKMANIGQNWLEVMVPFSYDYRKNFTASEVSRRTGIAVRTVSRILNKLVDSNLLRYEDEGRNKKFRLNLSIERVRMMMVMVEGYKSLKFSEKSFYLDIADIAKSREVVLFGSMVKGYNQKGSDIDILIIGNKDENILKFVDKRVSLQFISLKEFKKLLREGDILAVEIIENHVVFGGSSFIDFCWDYYWKIKS